MEWDWAFVVQILPTLIEGVKITIIATLLGSVLAAIVGLVIAIIRRSSNRLISMPMGFIAEFIRGTAIAGAALLHFLRVAGSRRYAFAARCRCPSGSGCITAHTRLKCTALALIMCRAANGRRQRHAILALSRHGPRSSCRRHCRR